MIGGSHGPIFSGLDDGSHRPIAICGQPHGTPGKISAVLSVDEKQRERAPDPGVPRKAFPP
ncbi:UvrD/REP helicase [Carbonactinospora thermoautotrophica]|uniref:UvrD/REP helicase n=1 Tax=Carbonactinospora thermoautotrophica TaxID=1469144 RepID=A0A132MN85_9ACTN|nr:UvrD/REP helicase [Carbonactinospora thermoautotrophica]